MSKLVVLELDGDFEEQGFRVSLEIGAEGDRPEIEIRGALPPNSELVAHIQQHWQEKYRRVGAPTRKLKPKRIKYDGSVNEWLGACRESAEKLRHCLSSWLDCEEFREIDKRLREKLKQDEPIRILIRTENQHLQKIPWHLWDFIDRYPLSEVALSSLKFERPNFPPATGAGKVRILAILGHSAGIDIESDRQILENLPDADVVFLPEPKREEIGEHLWEQPWDIVFFAGHSETEGDAGRIYINPTESLSITELWYGLKKAVERGLKLAIFNSCDGLGLARQLDDLLIPQIIVMRELVPDRVAQKFLKHFLAAFAGERSLYLAVREARERLHDELEGEFPCASWLPVIWQNPSVVPLTWKEWLESKNRREFCGKSLLKKTEAPVTKFVNWQRVLLASLACAAAVVGARSLGFLQSWELQASDFLMRMRPDEGADQRLLIVKITEKDIQQLDQYPISDRTAVRLFEKLEKYQPKVIGLNLFRDIPEEPGRTELVKYLQKNKSLIAICDVGPDNPPKRIPPPPGIPKERLGFSDLPVDGDRLIRRQLLQMKPAAPCEAENSFSFQIALHYLKESGVQPILKRKPANEWQIGRTVLKKLQRDAGVYELPPGEAGGYQILLNYRSTRQIAQEVTLFDILSGSLDPELPDLVKNRIVLIGAANRSSSDFHLTPYSATHSPLDEMPKVIIQAHGISQIVSAVLDERPLLWWWSQWDETIWILVWSFTGSAIAWRWRRPLCLISAGIVAGGVLYGVCFILLLKGGLIPLVPPALACAGAAALTYTISLNRQDL